VLASFEDHPKRRRSEGGEAQRREGQRILLDEL